MMDSELKKLFTEIGISETGVVSASVGNEAICTGAAFSCKQIISNINDILNGAKSIIVYLVPYNNGSEPVNLSLYATGRDYHKVCAEISGKIADKLKENGFKSVSFADIGPLSERKLAQKAGLGIIGDNGFIINEKYGSYTFIGYIVTDCLLSPTKSTTGECLKCGKCIANCPGNALNYKSFCEDNCISYITQKKGELTQKEKELIIKGKSAWGCDICQKVCPMNEGKEVSTLPDFNNDLILCIDFEYLSNNQFRKKYADRAFSWRGKSVIDRNLSVLNDNSK